MEKIYVWYIPKKDVYYHKVCKGYYRYNTVGDVNQYEHVLVHIIDLDYFLTHKYKVNYKKMLINDTIRFLENLKKGD